MASNIFGIIPEEGSEAQREAAGEKPEETPASPATTPDEQDTTPEETAAPSPDPEPTPQADPAPETASPEGEAEEEEEGISEDGTGFRIGNKVYKDIMAADHAFRQNRGRAQAEARRAKALEDEKARLLEEVATLRAQASVYAQSQPPQADPAAPAQQAAVEESERLTQPLTRDQINELIAEEGADVALEKVQEIAEKRMMEMLDARTAPLRQQEEIAEAQQVASENFYNVSQMTGADGKPLFPALDENSETAGQVVAVWDQLVTEDPDFRAIALSPAGVKFAYREWERLTASSAPAPADTSQPPAPPSAPPAPGGTAEQSRALASMGRGQASPPPSDPNRPPTSQLPANPEEAVRKLLEARQHSVFGVTVEPQQQ